MMNVIFICNDLEVIFLKKCDFSFQCYSNFLKVTGSYQNPMYLFYSHMFMTYKCNKYILQLFQSMSS